MVLQCAGGLGILAFVLVRRGSKRERRGTATAALIGTVSLVAPFALAVVGLDFVDPRNLIGSIVPLLIAAGIAFTVTPPDSPAAQPPRRGPGRSWWSYWRSSG